MIAEREKCQAVKQYLNSLHACPCPSSCQRYGSKERNSRTKQIINRRLSFIVISSPARCQGGCWVRKPRARRRCRVLFVTCVEFFCGCFRTALTETDTKCGAAEVQGWQLLHPSEERPMSVGLDLPPWVLPPTPCAYAAVNNHRFCLFSYLTVQALQRSCK